MAFKPPKPPIGGELLDKISEWFGQTDTGLDQVKKSVMEDLDDLKKKQGLKDLAANLYLSAEEGFKTDLDELGITGDEAQKQYVDAFKAAWQDKNMDIQAREILASPEKSSLDSFITDIENLPLLRTVIDSAEPAAKWESVLKGMAHRYLGLDMKSVNEYFGPVLSACGLGFLMKKGAGKAEAPAQQPAPQQAEEQAPEEAPPPAETAEGEETEEAEETTTQPAPAKPAPKQPAVAPAAPARGPRRAPEPYKGKRERSEHLLADIEANYKPHWVPITLEKGGHTLKFRVAARPYNQPMDGPTAQAAAARFDAVLPHPWLVEKIHEKAKKVPFIDAVQVCKRVNRKRFLASEIYKKEGEAGFKKFTATAEYINWNPDRPDGKFMMSQEFMDVRNELFEEKCEELGIGPQDLVSDYGKHVTQPVPGSTNRGRLTISGGYRSNGKKVQGTNGKTHEDTYYDYSHYTQFVHETAEYDGQSMSTQDIFSDPKIASAFGFAPIDKKFAYTEPDWMKKDKPIA